MIKKQNKSNQKSGSKDLFQTAAPMSNTKKSSEYGKQLKEKQKVKEIYGVREKQFRRFFALAKKSKDATGSTLLCLLERRLDNVLFLLKFAKTRLAARKIIVHGHIELNGKRVFSPSIIVSLNGVVSLSEKIKQHESFMKNEVEVALARSTRVPGWLEVVKDEYKGKILRLPLRQDIEAKINENYIVELYSK